VPEVSVIVPAYNASASIGDAVASALAQSLSDLEVIVVDDASGDDTAERVQAISASEERVRLIRLSLNRGPAHARDVGIEAARGGWIAPLDADDLYASDRLSTLLALAHRWQADLMADNQVMMRGWAGVERSLLLPEASSKVRRIALDEWFLHNLPGRGYGYGLLKPIMRREFLRSRRLSYPDLRFGEDFVFYSQCLLRGARFFVYGTPLYHYRFGHGPTRSRSRVREEYAWSFQGNDMVAELVASLAPRHAAALALRARLMTRAMRYDLLRSAFKEGGLRSFVEELGLEADAKELPYLSAQLARSLWFRMRGRTNARDW
jgi:glycosyltransferase involved in cell wall biosynthesis